MPSEPKTSSPAAMPVFQVPVKQLIFVMGVTGVGKSTFIQYCTGQHVDIGDNLKPCKPSNASMRSPSPLTHVFAGTKKVETYQIPGTDIYLLDTPGFDDPVMSDTEILQNITSFLEDCRADDVQIMGALYIHPITETKMKRSGLTNLLMFRKIVGKDNMHNIRLVTTKWTHEPRDRHESNEHQLATSEEYWKPLLDAGAEMVRFEDSWASAMEILRPLVQGEDFTPRLLEEVDQGLSVPDTGAGQVISDKVDEALRARSKEIAEFLAAQQQAEREKDAAYASLLSQERQAREADRERLVEEQRKLAELRAAADVAKPEVKKTHDGWARFGRWTARTSAVVVGGLMTHMSFGTLAPAAFALYTAVETGVQTQKHLARMGK